MRVVVTTRVLRFHLRLRRGPILTRICGSALIDAGPVFASTDGTTKASVLTINVNIQNFFIIAPP
jgi:hypothetical protein